MKKKNIVKAQAETQTEEKDSVPLVYTAFCEHQFIKIADETHNQDDIYQKIPVRWGVKVMCANCGEIRILWTDGEVEHL